jgi:hypothetical protein
MMHFEKIVIDSIPSISNRLFQIGGFAVVHIFFCHGNSVKKY